MGNRYVNVEITRDTKPLPKEAFGFPLILSTEKEAEFKEYTNVEAVKTDFGADSETAKVAKVLLEQRPKVKKIAIFGKLYESETGTPADLTTALDALIKTHGEFFYLTATDHTDAVITALSNWNATKERFYFASTSNQTLHDTLKANENTILLVHPKPETYPAESWIGKCAPLDIGSYTFTFMTLDGIEPAGYDDDELDIIEVGASSYIRQGGVNITSKGITTSGEYIDIIQGQYYLKSAITSAVFKFLASMPKVPYVGNGINSVVGIIASELKTAANMGIIAKDADGQPLFSITAPDISEISEEDRKNRILPDVDWDATIEGSIENVDIRGSLKV